MTDAEEVRRAIHSYMEQHGLTPTRWSLDAGLSGRALSHFLSGRSKSLAPKTLEKLAEARKVAIREMLGFLPSYMDHGGDERRQHAVAEAAALAQAVLQMAEELRRVHAKLDELAQRVAPAEKKKPGKP